MKKLTYNNYITAKQIVRYLCEEYHLIEKLLEHNYSAWNKFTHKLEENGFDYFSGATKGCIWDKEDMPEWVIKFDLGETKYCEMEYENFRSAVKEGYDHYLTTTKKLLTIDGITFYLAERVECDEYATEDTFTDTLMESGCFDSRDDAYDCLDNQDTYERVVLAFGDYDFAGWIEYRGINDLHCGNFGVRGDGSLVIIDYSGF